MKKQDKNKISEQKRKKRFNYIKTGIRWFVLITIVTITIIFLKTIDAESWNQIKQVNPLYLGFAIISAGLAFILDGTRVWIFAKALGHDVPLFFCIGANLSNIFVSTVTPFQSGGAPLQIYMLTKKGVPVGNGITIGLVKWLLLMFVFGVISTMVFFHKDIFMVDPKVFKIFKNVIIFVLAIIVIFMMSGFFPFFYKKVLSRIIMFVCRIKFLRKYRNRMIKLINGLIEEFHSSFMSFLKNNKFYLLLNLLVTVLFMSAYSLVAVFLLAGFDKIDMFNFQEVIQIILLQIFLIFVIYFSPTPGSSGTMEAGFTLLFINIATKSTIGFIVLFWRMLTSFIPVIIGGLFILKFFSGKPISREIKTTIDFEKKKIREELSKAAEEIEDDHQLTSHNKNQRR